MLVEVSHLHPLLFVAWESFGEEGKTELSERREDNIMKSTNLRELKEKEGRQGKGRKR
jgi:hypothetical protein